MAETTTEQAETKTEVLLRTAKARNGATVEQLMEATGQSKQVVRSRIYTLGKAGKIAPVDGSEPRRYKTVKPVKA